MNLNFKFTCLPIFIFLELFAFNILGQEEAKIAVFGRVINKKEGIPFANVALKNTGIGTATNTDGYFRLNIKAGNKDQTIVISSIGYLTKEVQLHNHDLTKELQIELEENIRNLSEIVVRKIDAASIVKQALQNLEANFEAKPHRLDAFYRNTYQENSKFSRLLEAAVYINDPKGRLFGLRDLFIREMRKSDDLRKDKWKTYDGYLSHLVRNHPVSNPYFSFMKVSQLKHFDIEIVDTKMLDSKLLYELHLKPKKRSSRNAFEVTMTIRDIDFAIYNIKIKWKPELAKYYSWAWEKRDTAIFRCNWQESNYHYQEFEGKFYLKSAQWQRKGSVVNTHTQKKIFDTESLDELLINSIETGQFEQKDNSIIADVFELANTMKYNKDFWKNYNRPVDSEHFKLAKSELEKLEDLELQFVKNGMGKAILK